MTVRLTTGRGNHYGESIPAILHAEFGPPAVLIPGPDDLAAYVGDASCSYGILADVYGSDPPEAITEHLSRRSF